MTTEDFLTDEQRENMSFILNDKRLCRSDNMKRFFRIERNRFTSNVIRFEGKLWFASFGWDADEKGFAGVKVMEVACFGSKAKTCYPSWQRKSKWENVTKWFWDKYKEQGIVSIPEIWNRKIPRPLTSKEAHSI